MKSSGFTYTGLRGVQWSGTPFFIPKRPINDARGVSHEIYSPNEASWDPVQRIRT
jgi:hypothetical protein